MLLSIFIQFLKFVQSILTSIGLSILSLYRILILFVSFLDLKYEMSYYYICRKRNMIENRRNIPFKIREDNFLSNFKDYSILCVIGFVNFLSQILMVTPIIRTIFGLLIEKLSNLPLFIRRVISFTFGFFISYFLFIVFNAKDTKKNYIIAFTAITVPIFTLFFSISMSFRCIIFLAIPKILITQLRFIILYQISVLVLTGPLITIQANSQILCELALCSAKISYDITMEKVKEATRPLLQFVHSFQILAKEFKAYYETMKKFLIDSLATLKVMQKYMATFLESLSNIFNTCDKKMSGISSDCSSLIYSAEKSCFTFLDFIPLLNLSCYLVRILLPICNSIFMSAKMCQAGHDLTDKMGTNFKEMFNDLKIYLDEVFYVDLDVTYVNEEKMTRSDSLKMVYKQIINTIEEKFDFFHLGLSAKVVISILIMTWVLYSSYAYRKKYLKYDSFDNVYISKELNVIDNKRAMYNLETIFPLYPEEKIKYLTRDSIFISNAELIDILKNYLILLMFTFQLISVCVLDYLVYTITSLFTDLLNDYSKQNQHMIYMKEVDDSEPNILIESINNATNVEALAPIKSLLECKKNNAFPPIPEVYKKIAYYLVTLCAIYFTRGYFRRSLSLICSYYYPERKNKRNIHLYLTILRTRANIFLYLTRGLKQTVFRDKTRVKINLWERFLAHHPILTLWLIRLKIIKKKDFCSVCGLPGFVIKEEKLNKSPDKLYPCSNVQCSSVFCLNCTIEFKFKCILCKSKIIKKHKSYKALEQDQDKSDLSEEFDSGDDWKPFYFEEINESRKSRKNRKKDNSKKLEKFYKQLKNLSNLKEKEEKKFLAYLCSPEEDLYRIEIEPNEKLKEFISPNDERTYRNNHFRHFRTYSSRFNFVNFIKKKLGNNEVNLKYVNEMQQCLLDDEDREEV